MGDTKKLAIFDSVYARESGDEQAKGGTTMPKISPDGNTVYFRVPYHYLKDIKAGRKKADIRKLDSKWAGILSYAQFVQFNCIEEDEGIEVRFVSITRLEDNINLKDLYCDLDLKPEPGKGIYLIRFAATY